MLRLKQCRLPRAPGSGLPDLLVGSVLAPLQPVSAKNLSDFVNTAEGTTGILLEFIVLVRYLDPA